MDPRDKWERVNQNLTGINRKLKNPDVPKSKKEKLLFQKKHLEKNVIPRLVSQISAISHLDPLWKMD